MRKIILMLMSAILCASLILLSGCVNATPPSGDGTGNEENAEFKAVYAAYVAFAEKNGEKPDSYEAWLESIKGADGLNGVTPEFKVENGILSVTYNGGETWTALGNVAGEDGAPGKDGADGENGVDGAPGKDGNGIKDMSYEVNADGSIKVTVVFTDDDTEPFEFTIPAGQAGVDGKDGVGIKSIDYSMLPDGTMALTIYYTDDSLAPVVLHLPSAEDGKDGEDGVGIEEVYHVINDDGSITVTMVFTDDTLEPYVFVIPASTSVSVVNVISEVDPVTGRTYFYFVYSDGTLSDPIYLPSGSGGDNTVGITRVEFNEQGDLVIFFADGTSETVAVPKDPEPQHSFGEWVLSSAGGKYCGERLYFHVCDDCGDIEWKIGTDDVHEWNVETVAPNCTNQGYNKNTCGICGKVEYDTYTETNGAHTPDDSGYCVLCDAAVTSTAGLEFSIFEDGTYATVTGYTGTYNRVNIVSTYEGVPVTGIGSSAFYNCTSLTSVTIPNSVTSIGSFAFFNCKSLTSVTIPASVTSIGDAAFYGCTNLTSVTIPDSVTSIGSFAFSGCTSLTSVTIPDSVTSIGDGAFHGCSSLTNISVDENNTAFKSIDGNLYSKEGTILFQYAVGKTDTEFVIPDNVTSIGYGAFGNCTSLTSVTIPDSVTSIGSYAFYGCTNLTSITIPDSVTSIGESAFAGCASLSTVYYTGTEEKWNNITFISVCEELTNATIVFEYSAE